MLALCLGGAPCVWDDVDRARALVGDRAHVVVACNDMGWTWPERLDAWATLHSEMIEGWRADRERAGFNTDYRVFIHDRRRKARGEVFPQTWYGSSGLYMAQVALGPLGCAGAILCGVPMDAEAGHIGGARSWPFTGHYRPAFETAAAQGAAIRSMSGWSAGVLGEPDSRWIGGLNDAGW